MAYDKFAPDNASSAIIRSEGGDPSLSGLKLMPEALYFGALVLGEDPLVRTFMVTNQGDKAVRIESVQLQSDNNQFVLSGSFPSVLLGGQSFTMTVSYASNEIGLKTAVIIIHSDGRLYSLGVSGRVLNSLLVSSVTGDFQASIDEEFIARTTADEALAEHILNVQTSMGANIASSVLEEQISRTTQYETLAENLTQLDSKFTTGLSTALAQIIEEQKTRATAISAEAAARQALSVTFNTGLTAANAAISDESNARVTQLGAIATRTTNLEVNYTDLNTSLGVIRASITSNQTASATADTALASRIDSLTTSLGAAQASVTTEINARATADSALSSRVDTINATVGGFDARITNEQTARVNGDSANATAITNLTSTVNGHTASISTQASAITDINNRTQAFWQVTAVAGGRAQLTVYAFANGGAGVDIVGDVHISGNLLVDGTITTGKYGTGSVTTPVVAPNSINQIYFAQTSSNITISTNVEGTAIYVDCVKTYADTVMKIEAVIRIYSPDDAQGQYNMYRDTTVIDGMYVFQVGSGRSYNTTISFTHVDTDTGTGSRRYKITYIPKDNDVSSQQIISGTCLVVTEVKR